MASLAALLCAFLASVTWAIGSALYGKLVERHSPFTVNFLRACVALPFHAALSLLFFPESWSLVDWSHVGWLGMSMISSYVLADALFMKAIQYLGLSTALSIASAYPFWSALWGWWVRGEALSVTRSSGLVFVVMGSIIVIRAGTPVDIEGKKTKMRKWGLFVALLTSVLWSLNPFALAQAGSELSSFTMNTIRLIFAVLFCPLFAFSASGPAFFREARADFKKYWPIFFLESGLGSFFFVYGVTHAPLAVATGLTSLAPVVSVPVALLMKIEKPSPWKIGGVMLVAAGVILLVNG